MYDITAKVTLRLTLPFRDRTADSYCADVTLFLHAMSVGLSLTAVFFSEPIACVLLLEMLFIFSRCDTAFSPNIIPHKRAEQDQIDAKWLEIFFI